MFNLRALRAATLIAMSALTLGGSSSSLPTEPRPPKIRSSSKYLLISNGARERARRLRQLRSGTLRLN